jgi:negative regulator of sigma E activity
MATSWNLSDMDNIALLRRMVIRILVYHMGDFRIHYDTVHDCEPPLLCVEMVYRTRRGYDYIHVGRTWYMATWYMAMCCPRR